MERLSRGFGYLQNIEGKVPPTRAEEDSDVDSEEELKYNEEKYNNNEKEEPFRLDYGDLKSIRECCKALAINIIDERASPSVHGGDPQGFLAV